MSNEEAQVDWDDNGLLDVDECHAKIRQLCTILGSVEATLADCGTGGVYAEFDTPADAIAQMNDQIKELTARLATLDAAEAALVNCGIAGVRDTFDSLADAIQQMSEHIQEQSSIIHVHEHALNERDKVLQAERRLRQVAEHYTESLRQELDGVHDALNECGISRHYGNRTGSAASARTRIFWLSRRAERAEALAQLVNEETAGLLGRLIDIVHNWGDWDSCGDDLTSTRKLAAQIREVLVDEH